MRKDYDILVNKTHTISMFYVPNDLVVVPLEEQYGSPMKISKITYEHFLKLQKLAKEEKIDLCINNGYRSYLTQSALWLAYSTKYGIKTTKSSVAFPGTSEHQTGLAIDLAKKVDGTNVSLTTAEYKTIQDLSLYCNFILRYPKGKESITGYQYEPWHYRYLPDEDIEYFKYSNDTLEEYYQKVKKR